MWSKLYHANPKSTRLPQEHARDIIRGGFNKEKMFQIFGQNPPQKNVQNFHGSLRTRAKEFWSYFTFSVQSNRFLCGVKKKHKISTANTADELWLRRCASPRLSLNVRILLAVWLPEFRSNRLAVTYFEKIATVEKSLGKRLPRSPFQSPRCVF